MKTKYKYPVQSEITSEGPLDLIFLNNKIELIPNKDKYIEFLEITVPGRPEENRHIASEIAIFLSDFIQFSFGPFSIKGGFLLYERIPDNEEEREEIGDKPYGAEMQFEEVKECKINLDYFNIHVGSFWQKRRIFSAFVDGQNSISPIDQYRNYFRVIEDYYITEDGNIAAQLKDSDLKYRVVSWLESRPNGFEKIEQRHIDSTAERLIDVMVKLRHQCSHLKSKTEFGFSRYELQKMGHINDFLPLLKGLAFGIINRAILEMNSSPTSE